SLMHNYFTKAQAFDSFGLIVSGLFGAFLVARIGFSVIWPVAAASFLASFLILTFAKEGYIKRKVKIKEAFKELINQTKRSANYSYKHHVLFYFLLAGFVALFSLNLQANISWIPLLQSLGMPDYAFGYLWSMIAVVIMVSPLLATKLLKKGKERNFIILGMVLCALITSLILFAFNLILAVAVMLGALFFYFAKRPAERVYFHRFIPSKLRATIGSIEGLILSIATIISLPLAGILVDKIGARYTIFISALVMIPAIIIYLMIKEKRLK
ncbi:MAG TPA: MFS transporter, partial [Candidatus Nanoarchaeia archaeon]|nr:MFS transporter [Candidatus Nanoarchaeia archaeon]